MEICEPKKQVSNTSAQEVSKVFEECLKLVESREPKYGLRWKNEPIGYQWGNIFRKAEGIRFQYERGDFAYTDPHDREQLLDLINYTAFVIRRLNEDF
jgi:hypothetical protein